MNFEMMKSKGNLTDQQTNFQRFTLGSIYISKQTFLNFPRNICIESSQPFI